MSRFDSKTPISPGTGVAPGSLRTANQKRRMQNNATTQVSSFFEDPGMQKGFVGTESKPSRSSDTASTGIDRIPTFNTKPPKNVAEQVLGFDAYSQALGLGYKPTELMDMIGKARDFGGGINVDKFKTDLNRYAGFLDADGSVFKFDDPQDDGSTVTRQYLNVARPEISANPPEGITGLLGALFDPFVDMASAGADFMIGGGAGGEILEGLKNKFNVGKDFVSRVTNPGDLSQRLNAAGPEAQRLYAIFMQQPGMTYQRAFEMATGQAFAQGGVANL